MSSSLAMFHAYTIESRRELRRGVRRWEAERLPEILPFVEENRPLSPEQEADMLEIVSDIERAAAILRDCGAALRGAQRQAAGDNGEDDEEQTR